jgi:hypothetical protein
MIQFGYCYSPSQQAAGKAGQQCSGNGTSKVDPPTVPVPGYHFRIKTACRIGADAEMSASSGTIIAYSTVNMNGVNCRILLNPMKITRGETIIKVVTISPARAV